MIGILGLFVHILHLLVVDDVLIFRTGPVQEWSQYSIMELKDFYSMLSFSYNFKEFNYLVDCLSKEGVG